jgi:hypothetical protein
MHPEMCRLVEVLHVRQRDSLQAHRARREGSQLPQPQSYAVVAGAITFEYPALGQLRDDPERGGERDAGPSAELGEAHRLVADHERLEDLQGALDNRSPVRQLQLLSLTRSHRPL